MKQEFLKLKEQALADLKTIKSIDDFENLWNKYFSRKSGQLTLMMKELTSLSKEERPEAGKIANKVKKEIEKLFDEVKKSISDDKSKKPILDLTLEKEEFKRGHLHPNTIVQHQLEDIFTSMGFMILKGPELESDYYNFEALNFPKWHPARDMQDTFFIEDNQDWLMRTHTSPVQVRAMQKFGAPLRCVVPGRVFRNEDIDASHEHTFYQCEGLLVDKDIAITHLVAIMKEMLAGIFKTEVNVRLRPGYFPFVEPGLELDFECLLCGGKGCPVCKHEGWIEFLGAGMVHPNVLKYGKIDPEKYSGWAFGIGVTRLVMMKYEIDDIRLMQSGNLEFLKQF